MRAVSEGGNGWKKAQKDKSVISNVKRRMEGRVLGHNAAKNLKGRWDLTQKVD